MKNVQGIISIGNGYEIINELFCPFLGCVFEIQGVCSHGSTPQSMFILSGGSVATCGLSDRVGLNLGSRTNVEPGQSLG